MKKNKLELLDTNLLLTEEFKIVQYWLKVYRAEVGWHYLLDLTWQLKEILKMNLPLKATIIDAGAGNGMMQFILASLGYNILSVDFNNRKIPKRFSKIFNIKNENNKFFKNEYINHLANIKSNKKNYSLNLRILNHRFIYEYIKTRFVPYGNIKYITADFSNLDFIFDNSIDAIVSTSAIEHNKSIEKLKMSVNEFDRILKKHAPMIITTSATNEASWWHEPSKGYCFSEFELKNIFNLSDCQSNFKTYKKVLLDIKNSDFLKAKMPSYYINNPNCGMPFGKWDPKYVPVGIIKYKY